VRTAALALPEAVTRLSQQADSVSDEVWEEAARYYDEKGLSETGAYRGGSGAARWQPPRWG
jgi:hypothetical protein